MSTKDTLYVDRKPVCVARRADLNHTRRHAPCSRTADIWRIKAAQGRQVRTDISGGSAAQHVALCREADAGGDSAFACEGNVETGLCYVPQG